MSFGDDTDEMRQLGDAFAEMTTKVITSMVGPVSDLIRATTNATVDSLIDARERMLMAQWPPELANMVIITIINRNADVAKKVAEGIQAAQARGKKLSTD